MPRKGYEHFSVIAMLVVLAVVFSSLYGIHSHRPALASPDGEISIGDMKRGPKNISLSGREDVMDAANTRIWGEEFSPKGGQLGHWIWTGDINGDGLNDLAVAAPKATGATGKENDGKVYIFYGDGTILPEVIDLKETDPDVVIIGAVNRSLPLIDHRNNATGDLTNEITAGDYNGDGHRDMAIAFPYSSFIASVFIIWGDENGIPGYIELNETMRTNTPPPHDKIGGMGQAPGGDDLKTSNYLMTRDLDHDGIDELIAGGYSGGGTGDLQGQITIRWGSGGSTVFRDPQAASYFGWSLDIGDIDGDGEYDMVAGAPRQDNIERGLANAGSIRVFFNITRYKNGSMGDPFFNARPIINGSGHDDEFGRDVELVDVNGDGLDDIVASAPLADGIKDFNSACGQIFMFRGGPENSFPREMDAESDFDTVLIGPEPYNVPGQEANPESVGEVMEVGDVDGDGMMEFGISVSIRNLEPGDTGLRTIAGSVMLYEMKDLFPRSGGIVQMSHGLPFFTVDGEDIEDSLGFDMEIGDVDNDGIDDILIGVPGGDGPMNSRPFSGEAYVIRGSGLLIKGVENSGRGSAGRDLLEGGHPIYLNISYLNSIGASAISESVLHLDPDGMDIGIEVSGSELLVTGDPNDLVDALSSRWYYDGEYGWLNITLRLSWAYPRGDLDLGIDMIYQGEIVSFRTFSGLFHVQGNIMLRGEGLIYVDGEPIKVPGQWVLPGSRLSIENIRAVYSTHRSIPVPDGEVEMIMADEGGVLDSTFFVSRGPNELNTVIDGERYHNLTVSLNIVNGPPPGMTNPSTGTEKLYSFNLDGDAPNTPEPVGLKCSERSINGFSRSGNFDLSVNGSAGRGGDPAGSGVKYFEMSLNGGQWEGMYSHGGLFGTYYSDPDFDQVALEPHNLGWVPMERIDPSVSFLEWGLWSPEDSIIPPDGFSVRWHGALSGPDEDLNLRIRGFGEVMMVFEGERVINWTRIEGGVLSGPLNIPDHPVPVELYYRHHETTGRAEPAGLIMEYRDMDGKWQTVKKHLMYPSGNLSLYMEDDPDVRVRAIDWVGIGSDIVNVSGRVDSLPPEFDTSMISDWYGDPSPELLVSVDDGEGPGVNKTTVTMQTMPTGGQWSEAVSYRRVDEGSLFRFRKDLDEEWRGYVRFTGEDLLGNQGNSSPVSVGIDMKAPDVEFISPGQGEKLFTGSVGFSWRIDDGAGSGLNADSIMIRYRAEGYTEGWAEMDPTSVNRSGPYTFVELKVNIIMETVVEVQLLCSDRVGNGAVDDLVEITVEERKIDMAPVPRIATPDNGTRVMEGTPLIFDARGTSDDGLGRFDEIRLTWFSSIEGYLGSGSSIEKYLEPGTHLVTLFADDGTAGHNVSADVTVIVERIESDDDQPPPQSDIEPVDEEADIFIYVMTAFLVLLVVGSLMIWMLYRKRSEDRSMTSVGLKESTEDDLSYDGSE